MSNVKFNSVQDLNKYSDDGILLYEELEGKMRLMFRHLRESRSLSVHTVSEATGIKENTIDQLERGRKRMGLAILARLMRYYGFWVRVSFISEPQEIKLEDLDVK